MFLATGNNVGTYLVINVIKRNGSRPHLSTQRGSLRDAELYCVRETKIAKPNKVRSLVGQYRTQASISVLPSQDAMATSGAGMRTDEGQTLRSSSPDSESYVPGSLLFFEKWWRDHYIWLQRKGY